MIKQKKKLLRELLEWANLKRERYSARRGWGQRTCHARSRDLGWGCGGALSEDELPDGTPYSTDSGEEEFELVALGNRKVSMRAK